ncbi:T9SS type A sorting domain-containing protein, partial [Psychroserpens sp.]|uniref:T9SS type A sorting domain-containing protein n=1 Tax=Psychroserpens sp. TaxID=2020870 RepID=UPI0038583AD2
AETLTASDSCGIATVDFSEATTPGACSGDYTITRTWTATDECDNETIHIQTITVEDLVSPIWDLSPVDVTVNCNIDYQIAYNDWLNSFSGTDNCSIPFVIHNAPSTVSCPDNIEVTFELTDACGNISLSTATFIVDGTLHVSDVFENEIKLFPNPTKKYIYVKGLNLDSKIEVFNITGQKVLSRSIKNGKRIDFDIKSGLYMVKIISGQKTIIKKLVIR